MSWQLQQSFPVLHDHGCENQLYYPGSICIFPPCVKIGLIKTACFHMRIIYHSNALDCPHISLENSNLRDIIACLFDLVLRCSCFTSWQVQMHHTKEEYVGVGNGMNNQINSQFFLLHLSIDSPNLRHRLGNGKHLALFDVLRHIIPVIRTSQTSKTDLVYIMHRQSER